MTKREQEIFKKLEEEVAILTQCLHDISNSIDHEQAKNDADQCLEALSLADAYESVSTRVPIWIGIQIDGINTTLKLCIGLNMENGNEVTWRMSEDVVWNYDNFNVVTAYGEDAVVFDEENNLITK